MNSSKENEIQRLDANGHFYKVVFSISLVLGLSIATLKQLDIPIVSQDVYEHYLFVLVFCIALSGGAYGMNTLNYRELIEKDTK